MQIDSNLKREMLPHDVRMQLRFIDIDNVKWGAATFVIALYNIPLTLSLLALMKIDFLWFLAPFIVILNVWLIRLLIKHPYSTQFEKDIRDHLKKKGRN